ncbi:hypothetical protein BCEP27_200023 [Burkholderia cepacia]
MLIEAAGFPASRFRSLPAVLPVWFRSVAIGLVSVAECAARHASSFPPSAGPYRPDPVAIARLSNCVNQSSAFATEVTVPANQSFCTIAPLH